MSYIHKGLCSRWSFLPIYVGLESSAEAHTLSAMKLFACVLCLALALLAGCTRNPLRRPPPPEPGKHLTVEAKATPELSDREYLMRKATMGTRAERIEALDVIERANDPELLGFLLERLKKEDDRFIQIRIMQALANAGDVRAVPELRYIARWDNGRVGMEAIAALYELGDDSFVPKLIQRLRADDENPEMQGLAHRTLKRMTGADLPMNSRAWLNYYRAHRLAPYQSRAWFWPFRQPLPPTIEGTTKVVPQSKGKAPLPTEDVRIRRTNVSWFEFWKPDEP